MSQMENVDSRFSHLLQPIRDLAKNWDIDIAADLEAYLEEIGAISAQFDDDEAADNYKPPNFAEAALVIQGSTLVYSKKVEYLYGLIFRAVDHMIEKTNKKKDGKLASSIGPDGRDMDADGLEEEFELQPIDDLLQEADNIDLDEDLSDQQSMQQSRMSLRFTMALGPSASSSGGGADVGLSKDGADFKMNSCIMSETGALLLGGSLDQFQEPLQPLFADVLNPAQLLSPGLSRTMAANASNGILQQQQQQGQQIEFRPPTLDDSDSEDERRRQQQTNLNAPAQAASVAGQTSVAVTGPNGVVQKVSGRTGARVNKKVDVSSMWDTLDPYDQTSIPARPFKRGRTYRKDVKSEPTMTKSETKRQKKLAEINEDPLLNLSKSVGANFLKPFFSEFDYLYERLSRRKAQERRREIESRRVEVVAADEAVLLQDEADMHEGFDQQPELWIEPIATGAGFIDEEDDDAHVPDFTGGLSEVNDGSSVPNTAEYQSYEDLCRMHVEKYLKEAETFQQETELSRRVAEWNTRLEPMLKDQESRPPFDIQGYGSGIIKAFVEIKKKKKENFPSMPFAKLMEVNPTPYEVCRNFTAMLQLINNGNLEIQIEKRPGDEPTLSVHLFSLKLLSDDYESVAESYKAGGYMVENPEDGGRKEQVAAAPEVSKKRKQAAPAAKKGSSNKKKKAQDSEEEESDFGGDDEEEGEEEQIKAPKAKKSCLPARKTRKTNDKSTTEAEEEEYKKRQHLQRLDREDSASDSDNATNKRRGAAKTKKRKGAPGAAPEKENMQSV